ncbi:UDP-N-acetylmuramoyl-tripeptide--D-alanyl-D-alanine ligase [Frigidibacter sp. MR17.24]|uniref:UDP-N-acetylmuramoyl-tripeptide--D-alanyl-D- alanine ligase n=1 Tax=Frigidibacter sp. MR17.24 TaxID=3127345 RepID=UPI003012F909
MTDTLWTSAEAEAATGGRATQAFAVTGVSIDTRSLGRGDLFVALKDARDGHDFVRAALDRGAAAALVSRIPEGCTPDDPLLVVPDVLDALVALGRAGRARTRARVVGITGSVGKTSTKEMLRKVLAAQGRVHAAEASFNNHWGVPLTLARMPADTDFAVIEIGMSNPGEIAPLARLARPHVAVITTVAPAHLAAFGSLDGIAREKAAIFEGVEPGGTAVVPLGLPVSGLLEAAGRGHGHHILTFGADPEADWRLIHARVVADATVVEASHRGADGGVHPLLFKLRTQGVHFAQNALAVLAVAAAAGADTAVAALDLGQWLPAGGRGMRERIVLDLVDDHLSFDLIDDAYNANPTSVGASLEMLAAAEPRDGIGRKAAGRRIAILGDMLELGADEIAMHAALADHPAMARVTTVHCVGPRMKALWEALPRARRGLWLETAEEMVPELRHLADAGDVLLVKGSKGIKVALLVDAIRKLGQAVAHHNRGTE